MIRYIKKFSLSAFASSGAFLITLLAFFSANESIKVKERLDFENYSYLVRQSITYHLQNYVNVLMQTRSMFYSSTTVSRQEFKNYVDNLDILNIYPSIQGLGYVERIPAKDLPAHEAKIRQEGFPDYHVWPTFKRPEYFSIVYLEPFDWRNQKAFGFDMYTQEDRTKAMAGARDTGMPFMTDRVILVQETDVDLQYGFLIYVPLYFSTENIKTVEERRKNLRGFIYSPFRANNFFKNVMKDYNKERFGLEVYIDDDKPDNMIYSNRHGEEKFFTGETMKSKISFAGNVITLKFFSYDHVASSNYTPYIILILGTFFSLTLFWLVWKHLKNARLERERAKNYESLNRIVKILSAELDLDKLIQAITDAGLELSHATCGSFFYYSNFHDQEDYTIYSLPGSQTAFGNISYSRFREIFSSVFKEGTTVLLEDITKDPLYSSLVVQKEFQIRSLLGVPVISRSGEVIGALFYGHNRAHMFGDREKILVEGIASQAVIAIDNAQLHKETKEAVAARDEFLSIASHELKTPITSMKLQFQLAEKLIQKNDPKVFDSEMVLKRVKLVNIQLDRMNKLVNDMLESSRFSSRRMELKLEQVDMVEMVQTIIEILEPLLERSHIKLDFYKEVDEAKVTGDKHRLSQVINNFISNAMKYGDGKPIKIWINQNSTDVILKVQDFGLGIPEERLDKIFDRYERAISSSNISGLGLGLFIANEIIKAHRGKILVESSLGKGSTFTMVLPRFKS